MSQERGRDRAKGLKSTIGLLTGQLPYVRYGCCCAIPIFVREMLGKILTETLLDLVPDDLEAYLRFAWICSATGMHARGMNGLKLALHR